MRQKEEKRSSLEERKASANLPSLPTVGGRKEAKKEETGMISSSSF